MASSRHGCAQGGKGGEGGSGWLRRGVGWLFFRSCASQARCVCCVCRAIRYLPVCVSVSLSVLPGDSILPACLDGEASHSDSARPTAVHGAGHGRCGAV